MALGALVLLALAYFGLGDGAYFRHTVHFLPPPGNAGSAQAAHAPGSPQDTRR